MRVLVGLSVLQTIAIGFLTLRVMEIDRRAAEPALAAAPIEGPDRTPVAASGSSLSADDIRSIIREEFAAAKPENSPQLAAAPAPQGGARPDASRAPADPRLFLAVTRDIDRYISRGRISPKEMAALQMQIAELPSAERTEILTKLTKAMNDGRLAGEF